MATISADSVQAKRVRLRKRARNSGSRSTRSSSAALSVCMRFASPRDAVSGAGTGLSRFWGQLNRSAAWRKPFVGGGSKEKENWRPRPESNRRARICSPLRHHSATWPLAHAHRLRHAKGTGGVRNVPFCIPHLRARDASIIEANASTSEPLQVLISGGRREWGDRDGRAAPDGAAQGGGSGGQARWICALSRRARPARALAGQGIR